MSDGGRGSPLGGDNPLYARLMAIRPAALSLNAWTLRAGVSRTFFNDVRKRGNARHDSLLKILAAAGVSLADFESGQVRVRSEIRGTGMTAAEVEAAWALERAAPVPLLGTAYGGDWEEEIELTELHLSEVLDNLARPPSLAGDDAAYAIEIVGDSMWPRFKPGERAYVSPKAAVRPGDDVVVQLIDPDAAGDLERRVTMVLIKELARRSASFVDLRQFNPDRTFRVPVGRVRRIHRVMGRIDAIDAWRRDQPDLPSRAEAIRRLVGCALEGTARPAAPEEREGEH